MTESTTYLRRLGGLGAGILLYWVLLSALSRTGQGALLMVHGLAAMTVGGVIAYRCWRDELGRATVLSVAAIPVLWGLGEFGWSSSFFLLSKSHRALSVVLVTELAYFLAFVFSVLGMLSAVEGGFRSFFNRRIVWVPLLLTTPIAFRLILDPFLAHRDVGFTAFNLGETTVISISYCALNLAILVLLSARSLGWSIFAAGILCLVFGDWSIRVDKITGQRIEFGLGSFFILFGLYSASLPFLWRERLGRIQPFESSSILNGYRFGLLLVALSMVLVYALYQREGVHTLKILCLGSGAVAFVAVFLSQILVERVQWFGAELGRVLRSELAQAEHLGEAADTALPVELREIYRLAFGTTVREQKLREEQRSVEERRRIQEQVAHDIRAPLAALNAAVDTLHDPMSDDNRRVLQGAVGRIRDIARDLMAEKPQPIAGELGRVNASSVPAVHVLSTLVEEVLAEKRLQYARSAIRFDVTLQGDRNNLSVFVHEAELKRALSNLIDNAVEAIAGQDPGKVAVRVANEGPLVVLSVSDNGKGIPEEILPQLGQRGVTRGKPHGKGLGLYQARSAIEGWGGSLKIRSGGETGTTVEIRLPQKMSPSTPARGVRVLVIDDDEMIAWAWRKKQARLGILELYTFSSMERCEAAGLKYEMVDLAFVDLHIQGTAWPIDKSIAHLKARGVQRVFVASGSQDAESDPRCQAADGLAAEKVPDDLARYMAIAA